MKICFCENCRYMFPASTVPGRCPDCGGKKVRYACRKERLEYQRIREIIREEDRLGVI